MEREGRRNGRKKEQKGRKSGEGEWEGEWGGEGHRATTSSRLKHHVDSNEAKGVCVCV